jgi:hypothetical protein
MGGGLSQLAGQERQIGIIDFYGLKQVSPAQLREALTFKQGDAISFPGDDRFPESEERLSKVPGIVRARINSVCCDNGRVIVYVGIEERGTATMHFRAEPVGTGALGRRYR